MSTYEYDQPTWQQYMQAMSDALAAPPAMERISGYGEQCADTDGMAGLDNAVRLAQCQQDLTELLAECTKLVERCIQAEVNLARANQERDALRAELAQRMAIPARALRSYD